MSDNSETQYLNLLAFLDGKVRHLVNHVDNNSAVIIKEDLDFIAVRLREVDYHSKEHNIDTSKHYDKIYVIKSNLSYISAALDKKPRGFFESNWIESIAEQLELIEGVEGILKFFGILPIVSNLIKILRNMHRLLPSPSPSPAPQLPRIAVYSEQTNKEIPSDYQLINLGGTRPPNVQTEYLIEETPVYAKFSTTNVLIHQDFLHKNTKGLLIDVDMLFKDMANTKCKVQLSFWLANGRPIINRLEGGLAKLEKSITPDSEHCKKSIKFFMANSKLGLGISDAGLYRIFECKILINAVRQDSGQIIGNKKEVILELKDISSNS